MLVLPPLINGKSYENADIAVTIGGVLIAGITSINYMDEQNIEGIYGAGSRYVSFGKGQVKTEGSITLLMEEVNNIVNASVTGRLQDIPPFDIVVSFVDAQLATKTHVLKNCLFKSNKIDSKSGDTSIPVEIPLFIGNIKWK